MIAQRVLIAGLVGVVAFLAVEAAQANAIVDEALKSGITANVGGLTVPIKPPGGDGGETIRLPPKAREIRDGMHAKAAAVAAVAIALAFVATRA